MSPLLRVCVFCGSSRGARASYVEAARALGAELAARSIGLVYGGGNVGLMGELADAALGGGGEVIGVIPRSLVVRELGHRGVTELVVVRTMHERKAKMVELANAFIALPGGFGTFDELCEVITWAQLGIHAKSCAVLDVDGYFEPLIAMFDRAVVEGFIRAEFRQLLIVERDADRLLDRLEREPPPSTEKWADRAEA